MFTCIQAQRESSAVRVFWKTIFLKQFCLKHHPMHSTTFISMKVRDTLFHYELSQDYSEKYKLLRVEQMEVIKCPRCGNYRDISFRTMYPGSESKSYLCGVCDYEFDDEDETQDCEIIRDTAGWMSRPRLTCVTCSKTLMCQPYMTRLEWKHLVKDFEEEHSKSIQRE